MKNKKGFTLVELLAVIVILGVLLLVAVPAVSNVIENTKFSADKSEFLELIDSVRLCAMSEGPDACNTNVSNYLKGKGTFTSASLGGTKEEPLIKGLVYTGANGYKFTISNTSGYTVVTAKDLANALTKPSTGKDVATIS